MKAALSKAVLAQPRLARIVRTRSAIRPMAIKGGKVYLYNHNPLLRTGYPGTLGVKTGDSAVASNVVNLIRCARLSDQLLLERAVELLEPLLALSLLNRKALEVGLVKDSAGVLKLLQ